MKKGAGGQPILIRGIRRSLGARHLLMPVAHVRPFSVTIEE